MIKFSVVVPILNPGPAWASWIHAVKSQHARPERIIVIDSGSTDGSVESSIEAGLDVLKIAAADFNHGATRQLGVLQVKDDECDVVLFLTQDAILADPEAFGELLKAFEDERVGAAYGRQLPHAYAKPMGAHARQFNYTAMSALKGREDIAALGIKTCFISNSFAAYRVSSLLDVGGFPGNVILGEDTCVAGRIVLRGLKVAYVASALAHHSHDYSIWEDFRRYFDTGVLHAREKWLLESFGGASGEGMRFLKSELKFVRRFGLFHCVLSLVHTVSKYLGYRLGLVEHYLPKLIKRRFSMYKNYWLIH